jgi:assimilatory nitrate reductase catalytic subunit
LVDGALASITTRYGSEVFRVAHSAAQRRGELFCPIHWSLQFSSAGRVGRLANAAPDPVSGQPEFKHTPARIAAVMPRWQGFLITTGAPDLSGLVYWTRVQVAGAMLYEIAGDTFDPDALAKLLPSGEHVHRVEAVDHARGSVRIGLLAEGRLVACLFIAADGRLPSRDWLVQRFAADDALSPLAVLAGRPAEPLPDCGAQVCVCFNVGLNTLIDAIRAGNLRTVGEVGDALRAGTNCGSCKPQIQSLLRDAVPGHATA